MHNPHFWNDSALANKDIRELKRLKAKLKLWQELRDRAGDFAELVEIAEGESDHNDLIKESNYLERRLRQLELEILLKGKFDINSAIIDINAGAGGTEACDWAGMLFRMYSRWAEKRGYGVKVVDVWEEEGKGLLKSVTFIVEGDYAYGYLKAEKGVHRLVRISPFDANRRRHTSFASVGVLPEIENELEVKIDEEDLKIETFRASGHGGQHVNRTDSAVRITHLPSGITAQSQRERSQYQNKQTALRILKARLYELKEQERQQALNKIAGSRDKIEWGSQIRSYILHPYLLVKDHRSGFETSRAQQVLDGDIDDFIFAYLRKNINSYDV